MASSTSWLGAIRDNPRPCLEDRHTPKLSNAPSSQQAKSSIMPCNSGSLRHNLLNTGQEMA
eukprot:8418101-Alexandrium_andersonii.AAC.1